MCYPGLSKHQGRVSTARFLIFSLISLICLTSASSFGLAKKGGIKGERLLRLRPERRKLGHQELVEEYPTGKSRVGAFDEEEEIAINQGNPSLEEIIAGPTLAPPHEEIGIGEANKIISEGSSHSVIFAEPPPSTPPILSAADIVKKASEVIVTRAKENLANGKVNGEYKGEGTTYSTTKSATATASGATPVNSYGIAAKSTSTYKIQQVEAPSTPGSKKNANEIQQAKATSIAGVSDNDGANKNEQFNTYSNISDEDSASNKQANAKNAGGTTDAANKDDTKGYNKSQTGGATYTGTYTANIATSLASSSTAAPSSTGVVKETKGTKGLKGAVKSRPLASSSTLSSPPGPVKEATSTVAPLASSRTLSPSQGPVNEAQGNKAKRSATSILSSSTGLPAFHSSGKKTKGTKGAKGAAKSMDHQAGVLGTSLTTPCTGLTPSGSGFMSITSTKGGKSMKSQTGSHRVKSTSGSAKSKLGSAYSKSSQLAIAAGGRGTKLKGAMSSSTFGALGTSGVGMKSKGKPSGSRIRLCGSQESDQPFIASASASPNDSTGSESLPAGDKDYNDVRVDCSAISLGAADTAASNQRSYIVTADWIIADSASFYDVAAGVEKFLQTAIAPVIAGCKSNRNRLLQFIHVQSLITNVLFSTPIVTGN